MMKHSIFSTEPETLHAYKLAMYRVVDLIIDHETLGNAPYSGVSAQNLKQQLNDIDCFPAEGIGISAAIDEIGELSLCHSLSPNHPATIAHLHCPVAIAALAGEVFISATNQSLDSWDQSPFATMAEEHVLGQLLKLTGFSKKAAGNFTSGGSQSNLTALYLATKHAGDDALTNGIIFTSTHSHFSILKSARLLGYPDHAIVCIATDLYGRMETQTLDQRIRDTINSGKFPVAIVATAGTTDLGAIDPLSEIASIAENYASWLHVDAAYGGGLLFSNHAERLTGIARARSVALDFHKMLFQPISCGALLLRDGSDFEPLAMKADYLNPDEAIFADAPNLVERSIQTSRRADALKLLLSLRAIGKNDLAALIELTLQNTQAAADIIENYKEFVLVCRPSLSTVVFRYVSPRGDKQADKITRTVRAALFHSGTAAVATTVFVGRVHFKFTLLNPRSTPEIIGAVLDAIREKALEMEVNYADD